MSLYKIIDLTTIDKDQFELEIEITDEEMLDELTVNDIVWHFDEGELLSEMGYDETYCFTSKSDMEDFIKIHQDEFHSYIYKFPYHNEQDIYKRVVDLLQAEKINYNIWENFLKEYE